MVSAMFIPLLVVSWYFGEGGISLMHVIRLELQKLKMITHFFYLFFHTGIMEGQVEKVLSIMLNMVFRIWTH